MAKFAATNVRDVKFTFDCILNKNVEAGHYRSYYEDPDAKDESERYKIKVSLMPGTNTPSRSSGPSPTS